MQVNATCIHHVITPGCIPNGPFSVEINYTAVEFMQFPETVVMQISKIHHVVMLLKNVQCTGLLGIECNHV